MRILLKDFKGEILRKSARLLPENYAQTANNCKLFSGEIRSLRNSLRVNNPSKTGNKLSLYRWGAVPGEDANGIIEIIFETNPLKIKSTAHGRTTGQKVFVTGTGLSVVDDITHTITIVDADNFTLNGVDGTSLSTLVTDSMIDTEGTLLGAHNGESGTTWESQQYGGPTDSLAITINGISDAAYVTNSKEVNEYDTSAMPTSANYSAEADIYVRSKIGNIGVAVKHSTTSEEYYGLVTDGETWWLFKDGGYNQSDLLGTYSESLVINGIYTAKLEVVGDTITAYIDGVLRITAVDTTKTSVIGVPAIITAPYTNITGMPQSVITSPTTGMQISYFSASETLDLTNGTWVKENGYFFHWLTDVDVFRGPIAGDTTERSYITGDGVPKMTYSPIAVNGGGTDYPNNTYDLGVPAPTVALTATPGAGGGCASEDQTSTAYVYTYVSALGEEGPPSPPSSVVNFCPGQTIDLSGMQTGPAGSYNITLKRIYRTASGSSSYQLVAEIPVANTTYADIKADTALGENIPSVDWTPPPSDLFGVGMLPNGIGYGFSKSDVFFTPAFLPHAWPAGWTLTTDYPIVGGGAFDTNIVVVTQGTPYLITGSDPASMSMTKIDLDQSCVSKRGIVGLDSFGVVYPSPDGLVSVRPGGADIVTKNYLKRDEWQAYKPESIVAFAHEGQYVAFYNDGTTQGGFIFDPSEPESGFTHIDMFADGGFRDLLSDALYLLINNNVEKWEGGSSKLSYTWKSKEFRSAVPLNMGAARVFAKSYSNLTLKLYADGVLKHTQSVSNSNPFRLPAGYYGEKYEIELTGTDDIEEVIVGESVDDLKAA